MTFLLSVGTLWKRELVRFLRQRSRIFGALGTPILFWLFIGSGLGSSFQLPTSNSEMNYLEFFYPGTILLIVLFTSIFSSLSIIEDRKEGFLLSVLVAPVSRYAIVLAKILGSTTLAFAQAFLLILLMPLLGIPLDAWKLFTLSSALLLISFCLSGLGFATAWKTESMQGYHSVMNVLLFPLWLLSGALFPVEGAFSWVRWIMLVNPLTYSLSVLRHLLYGEGPGAASIAPLPISLLVTVLFGIGVFYASLRMVQRGRIPGLQ